MNFSKLSLICILTYGTYTMSADHTGIILKKRSISDRAKLSQTAANFAALHKAWNPKSDSPELVSWPNQAFNANSGPSCCSSKYFMFWTSDRLNICQFGMVDRMCSNYADVPNKFSHDPLNGDIARTCWKPALSEDGKKAAVIHTDFDTNDDRKVDLFLYEWDYEPSGTTPSVTQKLTLTLPFNQFKDSLLNARPLAMFSAENILHYVNQSDDDIEIIKHGTNEKFLIPTKNYFLSLLSVNKSIKAAFTNENNDLMIYDQSGNGFLPPMTANALQIEGIDISEDARLAVSCTQEEIRVWKLEDGTCLKTLKPTRSKTALVFSTLNDCCFLGSRYVAACGFDGISVFDLSSKKDTQCAQIKGGSCFYDISASGDNIVAGGPNQDQFLILKEQSDTEQATQLAPTNDEQTSQTGPISQQPHIPQTMLGALFNIFSKK